MLMLCELKHFVIFLKSKSQICVATGINYNYWMVTKRALATKMIGSRTGIFFAYFSQTEVKEPRA